MLHFFFLVVGIGDPDQGYIGKRSFYDANELFECRMISFFAEPACNVVALRAGSRALVGFCLFWFSQNGRSIGKCYDRTGYISFYRGLFL